MATLIGLTVLYVIVVELAKKYFYARAENTEFSKHGAVQAPAQVAA
jgi:hypothetical protein